MSSLFTAEENRLLTETDAGTPMGDLMRRYWFPAFLSERLPEPGGDPMAITLLGEELVAFRASDGRIGLMDRYCPHRQASLALARVDEDCSIRCIYHGWKINVEGKVLETPPEPPNSRFAQSIKFPVYPTREAAGMVWTYMGPKDLEPPFPEFPFNSLPEENVWANHFYQPSNWLQGLEGDVDAGHAGYLHYSFELWDEMVKTQEKGTKFLFDPRPLTEVEPMPWGLQTMFRFALEDPAEATFWVHPFVMPFYTMFGLSEGDVPSGGLMHAWVPTTNGGHYVYSVFWNNDGPLTPQQRAAIDKGQKFTDVDPDNGYRSSKWTGSEYVQDRQAMRERSSFSGYDGVHLQDLAVQHSMGAIVDRTRENLGAEDFLVIQVRRFMLNALKQMEAGETLPALQDGMDHRSIPHRQIVGPADTPLREMMQRTEFPVNASAADDNWAPSATAWSPLPKV